jgi:hypothetical protein
MPKRQSAGAPAHSKTTCADADFNLYWPFELAVLALQQFRDLNGVQRGAFE